MRLALRAKLLKVFLLIALSVGVLALPAAAQEGFYRGATIEVIVPYSAGGGADTWARLVMPFLERELGASIQVINMPGAQAALGTAEYVLRRPRNGMTLYITSVSFVTEYATRNPALDFFNAADLRSIMGSGLGAVVFARPDAGVASAQDLVNPGAPLVFGGLSVTGVDLFPLLIFELIGADVQVIMGYEGRGPARVAFEQGEINLNLQTASAYAVNVEPLVEAGEAIPLFTLGFVDEEGNVVRDPVYTDLPSGRDVYVEIHGEEPSGPAWEVYRTFLGAISLTDKVLSIHHDAPPEAIEELLAAASRVVENPEFREAMREEVGDYPWIIGERLDQALAALDETPEELITWLTEDFLPRYGAER